MNYKIIDFLFFLICFTLPFSMIPMNLRLAVFGSLGNHLLVYPLFIGLCYSSYYHFKTRNVFVCYRRVILFLSVYACVLLLSLIVGLYDFPYYDAILKGPITQVKRIPVIINYFSSFGISITQDFILKVFLFLRPLRDIFVDVFYMFGTSYLIFCWYRNRFKNAIDIMCKATKCIIPILTVYGIIEILSLSGNVWCKEMLGSITPYIIECYENAYPPLFWYTKQIRLIFVEPSFIGNYLAILLPVVLYMYFAQKRNNYILLFYSFCIFMFVFLSQARTATAMALGIIFLYFLLVLFVYKIVYLKKCMVLLLVMVCSFVFSLNVIDIINYQSSIDRMELSGVTAEAYVDNNVLSVMSDSKRSNGARLARLKSNFRVGMEHPILGVGKGLITPYAIENFTEDEKKNWEVNGWLNAVKNEGILRYRINSMNEYVDRFAETGILGLIVFLVPFLMAILKILNCMLKFKTLEDISMAVMLISCLISGFNLQLNVIYSTWLVLGMIYSRTNLKV